MADHHLENRGAHDTSMDALWAKEANDRLAAYQHGKIRAVALSDVIAKYQVTKKPAWAFACWNHSWLI
jgi:hypothetical protein